MFGIRKCHNDIGCKPLSLHYHLKELQVHCRDHVRWPSCEACLSKWWLSFHPYLQVDTDATLVWTSFGLQQSFSPWILSLIRRLIRPLHTMMLEITRNSHADHRVNKEEWEWSLYQVSHAADLHFGSQERSIHRSGFLFVRPCRTRDYTTWQLRFTSAHSCWHMSIMILPKKIGRAVR